MGKMSTFGRILKSAKLGDSLLIETIHPAGLRLPRHDHDKASLNICLSGFYQERFGRGSYPCDQATVLLKPGGEFHSNDYGTSDTHCVMVEFGSSAAAQIGDFSNVLDDLWSVRGGSAAASMRELCRELCFSDRASAMIIEGCIWRVLGHAERQRRKVRFGGRPRWLGRVEDYLRENQDRRMNLAEIAALVSVHPAHLNRVFKRHFGVTVGTYLRHLQVERARQFLANPEIPLSQVAVDAGFFDQSHFTRVFKSTTGTTPADFRRHSCGSRPKLR
jgi:AraC family transcriptional regulator